MDENSAPSGIMTRSKLRRLSGTALRGARDPLKPAQNGPNEKKQLDGARRPALGDVTNRQMRHDLDAKHLTKVVVEKKEKSLVGVKNEVMEDMMVETQSTVVDSSAPDSPDGRLKPSPMCISSNLKEMSLDKRKRVYDIDSRDAKDARSVWQYAEDIYMHFLQVEKFRMPNPTYMDSQQDINSKMRAILIDWMVDVHAKYRMSPQTLHISIDLIDRFLSKDLTVPRQQLQLVGITAIFIASKYEEIYPPEVSEFVRITDNAYTPEEVFEMEETMLRTLEYYVTAPTAYQFLERFLKASGSTLDTTRCFALYVIDRTLQEYRLIKYPPSVIAASAVHIARTQLNERPAWHSTLEHHTTYSESCIALCIRDIKEIIWSFQNGITSSRLTAVKRKYSKEKFCGVSMIQLSDH